MTQYRDVVQRIQKRGILHCRIEKTGIVLSVNNKKKLKKYIKLTVCPLLIG